YGGDFGEFPHDGNFCMDGLVYPNRRPHTGLLELKNAARPLRALGYDGESGELELRNALDFTNAKDALAVRLSVLRGYGGGPGAGGGQSVAGAAAAAGGMPCADGGRQGADAAEAMGEAAGVAGGCGEGSGGCAPTEYVLDIAPHGTARLAARVRRAPAGAAGCAAAGATGPADSAAGATASGATAEGATVATVATAAGAAGVAGADAQAEYVSVPELVASGRLGENASLLAEYVWTKDIAPSIRRGDVAGFDQFILTDGASAAAGAESATSQLHGGGRGAATGGAETGGPAPAGAEAAGEGASGREKYAAARAGVFAWPHTEFGACAGAGAGDGDAVAQSAPDAPRSDACRAGGEPSADAPGMGAQNATSADAGSAGAGSAFCISEDERFITVSGRSFRYVFNRSSGLFDSISADNISYLQKPMEYNIWRAPTDNDRNVRGQWELAGYDRHTAKVYASRVEMRGAGACEKAVITASMSISAVFVQRILEIDAEWAIGADGALRFDIRAKRDAFTPWLPRFGLRLFLPEAFGHAEYFGYGPHESYIDKRRASWLSSFGSTVDGLFEDYIRPQENGSRFGCSRLAIYSRASSACASSGALAVAAVSGAFSFNASRYTQEELAAKKHNFELERSGHTVLCLDYKMSGVGSNSCGPELLPQYRLAEPAFRWQAEIAFGRRR
ncbi:MAG: hypothetical protein LBL83_05840, partial [Clostridiales bacterium]|nr:hypothetical protein [Clostridiales bacterium]